MGLSVARASELDASDTAQYADLGRSNVIQVGVWLGYYPAPNAGRGGGRHTEPEKPPAFALSRHRSDLLRVAPELPFCRLSGGHRKRSQLPLTKSHHTPAESGGV